MSLDANETTDAAAASEEADKMRQAAEVRRQRILDNANQRMGLVEGTSSDAVTESATSAADSAPAPSTSSRLAAMRRRRFKSSAAGATTEATATNADAVATDEVKTEATASVATETTVTESTTDAVAAENASPPETSLPEQPSASEPSTSTSSTKYMGVAKMRRRMLQEKQLKEGSTASTDAPTTVVSKKPMALRASKLPIVMHVVTVALLFCAGVDVGLQQGQVDYEYQSEHATERSNQFLLTVHSELAPRQMGGLQRVMSVIVPSSVAKEPSDTVEPTLAQEWHARPDTDTDEFDVDEATASSKAPGNLDPLFQVDLDQYTQGTGLYFSVARAAVRIHRLNLALLYHGPRTMFAGLVDLLWSLLQSPPVLCVAAILLRQVVGKLVLGARLPVTKTEEVAHKDVMTMIQNFVSNVILKSFPTAVTLYDVWTHLRADMYVVLCGFFVGLAWSHQAQAGSMYGGRPRSATMGDLLDDLRSGSDDVTAPESVADDIADTLADEL